MSSCHGQIMTAVMAATWQTCRLYFRDWSDRMPTYCTCLKGRATCQCQGRGMLSQLFPDSASGDTEANVMSSRWTHGCHCYCVVGCLYPSKYYLTSLSDHEDHVMSYPIIQSHYVISTHYDNRIISIYLEYIMTVIDVLLLQLYDDSHEIFFHTIKTSWCNIC